MTTSTDSFLVLDIGTAWTKGFLIDSSSPEIKACAKLPTTVEDIGFSAKLLISKLKTVGAIATQKVSCRQKGLPIITPVN